MKGDRRDNKERQNLYLEKRFCGKKGGKGKSQKENSGKDSKIKYTRQKEK